MAKRSTTRAKTMRPSTRSAASAPNLVDAFEFTLRSGCERIGDKKGRWTQTDLRALSLIKDYLIDAEQVRARLEAERVKADAVARAKANGFGPFGAGGNGFLPAGLDPSKYAGKPDPLGDGDGQAVDE